MFTELKMKASREEICICYILTFTLGQLKPQNQGEAKIINHSKICLEIQAVD